MIKKLACGGEDKGLEWERSFQCFCSSVSNIFYIILFTGSLIQGFAMANEIFTLSVVLILEFYVRFTMIKSKIILYINSVLTF